jgi:hypothetical protein
MLWKNRSNETTLNRECSNENSTITDSRPRRIYSYQRAWNRRPVNAYLAIDRFRSGDDWARARDSLQSFVSRELLRDTARYPVGSVSLYRVWEEVIPTVRPSHWITGGYRCQIDRLEKVPIVKVPVCLPERLLPTDDRIAEKIGGPVGFAIDSLPPPETLVVSNRDKLIFSATLLAALSLEVRDLMRRR